MTAFKIRHTNCKKKSLRIPRIKGSIFTAILIAVNNYILSINRLLDRQSLANIKKSDLNQSRVSSLSSDLFTEKFF